MCLAIPGRIVECFQRQDLKMARVQFGGIIREACLEYVPDAQAGDYVLVHVGFALSKIDEEEAVRTYALLEELDQLTDLQAGLSDEDVEHENVECQDVENDDEQQEAAS